MGLEKSRLQDHFAFKQMRSIFFQPPSEDMTERKYTVKDMKATENEYNVAWALDTIGLEYEFQMTVGGAKGQLGVVILDFLVYTVPLPTPLWVHGEHWHMGDRRAKDIRQQSIVEEALGGGSAIPVEIWGGESDTKERALYYTRRALR